MKINALVILLASIATSVEGASIRLEPRQFDLNGLSSIIGNLGKGLMGSVAPKKKAFKIEQLTPRNPEAKRIRITWGPLKIKGTNSTSKLGNGFSMDGGGTGFMFTADTDFPNDVVLLDGVVEIQNKDFKRATLDDNVYTHHFLVVDIGKPQKPSFTCSNGQYAKYVPIPGSVITGGAAEDAEAHYSTKIVGKKTGYHIKKNTPILLNIDVVNYNPDDMVIYASGDFEYIPKITEEYLDISPVFVPVTACDSGFMLPGVIQTPKGQSKWSLKSNGIIAAEDSILSVFRGHMHDGGSNVEVRVNDNLVCNSQATYGGPGHVGKNVDGKTWETIGNMITCPDGIIVKKGDQILLTANYDLDAHPARPGGHGGMLGGMLGNLLGGDSEHAEQMAVMIFFVAPLKK